MALTPEDDRVLSDLNLLQEMQLAGMDPKAQERFRKEITRVEEEYKTARKEADDKNLDEKQRKLAQQRVEAASKAVPGMVKGALAAASAFERGDNLTGAAAILDIAGAALGLLVLAGPAGAMAGALGGALLSAIGQILVFFAPKPPSMIEQIESLLAKYSALEKIAELKAVGKAINVYRNNLQSAAKYLPPVMEDAPATDKQLEKLAESVGVAADVIDKALLLFAPANFGKWGVFGWLETNDNKSNELWPQVLGLWCQANRDLLIANITLQSLANPAQMEVFLQATTRKNNPGLDPDDLRHANDSLRALNKTVKSLQAIWQGNNEEVLDSLNGFVSVARARGLYTQIGTRQRVYTAVGKWTGDLSWKQYDDNTIDLSINVPYARLNYESPEFDAFTCRPVGSSEPGIHRNKLYPTRGDMKKGPTVLKQLSIYDTQTGPKGRRQFRDCVDVCWVPDDAKPSVARVYTAHFETAPNRYSYINIHTVDADNKAWWVQWEPGGMHNDLQHVRALYAPPAPLPSDPDGDGLPHKDQHGTYDVIYGGYKGRVTVWVASLNSWAEVPTPWMSYTGIETDPDFVWAFAGNAFACATHASMIKAKDRKITQPKWITYKINGADLDKVFPKLTDRQRTNIANQCQILSFSPCADGTLNVALKVDNADRFLTANYSVSLKNKAIVIEPFKMQNSEPVRIIKTPIPCWQLFQSLRADLILEGLLNPNPARKARLQKAKSSTARKSAKKKPAAARSKTSTAKRSATPAAVAAKKKPAPRKKKSATKRKTRS